MRVVQQRYEIWDCPKSVDLLRKIERCGRLCHKSETRITEDSWRPFVVKLRNLQHESVLEHGSISVFFLTNRAVTHELVRHRIASFTQESQRYVAYLDNKPGNELCFVESVTRKSPSHEFTNWIEAMAHAEVCYMEALALGEAPEDARDMLPNSAKTELVITANLREWRYILKQRTSKAAWAQTRSLMIPLLAELKQRIPVVFDDIQPE